MIALSVADVAEVLGATLSGSGDAAGLVADVVIDSRVVGPGSLFVALPGERVDGHDYVVGALAAGAAAALTAHAVPGAEGLCLVVDDPALALGRLARYVVDRQAASGLRVVALTGSQGKTSTKDLLAQILEQAGPTVATHGNLNNELGVPLTAARVDEGTRFLVVEMGARGVGHIAYLCGLTPPQVGMVLNVGHAHVGEFGSQQAIARAKGELVEALDEDGLAVLNADDPLVWAMRPRSSAPVLAFSVRGEPAAERAVWASGVTSDELDRCSFTLESKGLPPQPAAQVQLTLSGRHHVANATAAAAAAAALGIDLATSARALTGALLRSGSRMEIHERSDGVVVINDAYNANPDSARAAVETLADITRSRRQRRRGVRSWAVLGDMLELGGSAADEHAALGARVAELGIDRLVAVGEHAATMVGGATWGGLDPNSTVILDSKSTAAEHVLPYLRPFDVVLVKASRGLALDTVAEEIWTAAPSTPSPVPGAGPEPIEPADSEDPA